MVGIRFIAILTHHETDKEQKSGMFATFRCKCKIVLVRALFSCMQKTRSVSQKCEIICLVMWIV